MSNLSIKQFQIIDEKMENAMHLLENSKCNDTTYAELPDDMRFNDGHVVTIFTYSILMMISAVGNITVLITTIIRKRKSKSRIHTLVMHLSIADLFVSTREHLIIRIHKFAKSYCNVC